jgi:HK97 family phage portal protein
VGFWSRLRFAAEVTAQPSHEFAVDADSVKPEFFGYFKYDDYSVVATRVDRRLAMQVPAVKRVRDIICTTIGGLPLRFLDKEFEEQRNSLLDQPERNIPRSVTMSRTLEDMLFEGNAWWRITEEAYGWPSKVVRLDPRSVVVKEDNRVYVNRAGQQQGTAPEYVPDSQLIRFPSPNDALLIAGARAIRTCLMLETAAARYAQSPMPQGIFTPTEGADPAEDDRIQAMLDNWKSARQLSADAYVPAGLTYSPLSWNPSDLQLTEARQHAVLEIGRLCGVDGEDLGVSTTSRTYQNSVDRKQALIDFTLAGYINAVQDRLSMNDVTPRGYVSRFDYSGFLRSDESTRMTTYQTGLSLGVYDLDYVRQREELPPSADGTPLKAVQPSDTPSSKVAP